MKYLLFAGKNYKARGGGHDLIRSSDDPVDLIMHGRGLVMPSFQYPLDWWHLYDTVEGEIVAGSVNQGRYAENLSKGNHSMYAKVKEVINIDESEWEAKR